MALPNKNSNLALANGTLYRSSFLDDSTVAAIQKEAKELAAIERARSKKQFHFGRMANQIWDEIKDRSDIKGQIYKDDLYVEVSYWINEGQEFPLVGASGETLRRWAETVAKFEDQPIARELEEVLSFDHFFRAKKLHNAGLVQVPVYPLAVAMQERLTAEEMTTRFIDPPEIEPEVLELRTQYPEWAWVAAYQLLGAGENRKQAEYHLREYVKIVSGKQENQL